MANPQGTNQPVTATVYIWYPQNLNVGHSSMHIGASKDPKDTNRYVSWWPEINGKPTTIVTPNNSSNIKTLNEDKNSEDAAPHVEFELYGLDVGKMVATWTLIKNKQNSHYKLYNKNCADIVARVLKAGGADQSLNHFQKLSYTQNTYWTPRNLAEWLNILRDKGLAKKTKNNFEYPGRGGVNLVRVAVGLR